MSLQETCPAPEMRSKIWSMGAVAPESSRFRRVASGEAASSGAALAARPLKANDPARKMRVKTTRITVEIRKESSPSYVRSILTTLRTSCTMGSAVTSTKILPAISTLVAMSSSPASLQMAAAKSATYEIARTFKIIPK